MTLNMFSCKLYIIEIEMYFTYAKNRISQRDCQQSNQRHFVARFKQADIPPCALHEL